MTRPRGPGTDQMRLPFEGAGAERALDIICEDFATAVADGDWGLAKVHAMMAHAVWWVAIATAVKNAR
jgi:hypothetical protein